MGFPWLHACVSIIHCDDRVFGDDRIEVLTSQGEFRHLCIHFLEQLQITITTVVAFFSLAEQPFQLRVADEPFLATLFGVLSEDHRTTSHNLSRHKVSPTYKPAKSFVRVDNSSSALLACNKAIFNPRLRGIAHSFLCHPGQERDVLEGQITL